MYILLSCVLILSGAVLLISVPAQAPEQVQIAFHSNRDWNLEVYVMDADGKNLRNLTNNPAYDTGPAWSPDGGRIAFYCDRDAEEGDIYVMDADGSNPRNLTNNPAKDRLPLWSPDGQKIVFESNRDGDGETNDIYVMDADGQNPHNLTNNPAFYWLSSWSPDGDRIAFELGQNEGKADIYVMDADGQNPHKLADHPAIDGAPDWFDPAFVLVTPVSPPGKLRGTWGWLKQASK
jgi:TolB protein